MAQPLSPAVEDRLVLLFSGEGLAEARRLLAEDCAENVVGRHLSALDRVRIAALKESGGTIGGLVDAIVLAQTDFRDLLVNAGFGTDVDVHRRWWPKEAGHLRARQGRFVPSS